VATCESEKLNHFFTAPRNVDQQVQVF
jgi:hypothetical protein